MITIQLKIKHINQAQYNVIIQSLDIHKLTCTCGHKGCLVKHAYYRRKLKSRHKVITLYILRLFCQHCKRTHAVLPSNIVPYQQIQVMDQVKIINILNNKDSIDDFLNKNTAIDENNVKRVFRSFLRHWLAKLDCQNILLDSNITENCFKHYSSQFMQIKKTKNTLFIETT